MLLLSKGNLPMALNYSVPQGLVHHGPQPVSEAITEQEQKQFSEQTGEEGEEKEEEQQGLAAGQQLSSEEADVWVSQTQVELSGS